MSFDERLTDSKSPEALAAKRALRNFLISDRGGVCEYCGSPVDSRNSTIDHVVPVSKGGEWSIDNLRIACRSCNARKNNRTMEEFRRLMQVQKLFSQLDFPQNFNSAHIEWLLCQEWFSYSLPEHIFYFEVDGSE